MGKFIYQHVTPHYTNVYFGDVNVYGDVEDVKIDDQSQFYCLRIKINGDPIRVRIGAIHDFSELPRLASYIIDCAFNGIKLDEAFYQRLCAVAGAMLVAEGQKVLSSGGHTSTANLMVFGNAYGVATDATQNILRGAHGAQMTIATRVFAETENPAIGNFAGLETSIYQGCAVN